MCGIAGWVCSEGAPSLPVVEEMAVRLRHRGPDTSGSHALPGCVVTHTRLRIIDLTAGAGQPMANEDRTVWVIFNGELYNVAELRRELRAAGHRFESGSDTEVLVHLYEEHGLRMAERLRGMLDRVAGALTQLGEGGLGFDLVRLGHLWAGCREGRVGWRAVWAPAVLGMWLEAHAGTAALAPAGSLA